MDLYVNPWIARTERVFPMQGRAEYLRLDMNENPEGLPEEIVEEIRTKITPEFLSRRTAPTWRSVIFWRPSESPEKTWSR